ncbi:unnamed protein product [Caenorhabditis bovis]|uniref:Uncharacterized protein n=1 Tax=Caenorhabditis bovis TaxID=2654633 RepID=A0A8S1FFF4_9PELO|nr:unnamed protein product [Caenorhabditis bovis]
MASLSNPKPPGIRPPKSLKLPKIVDEESDEENEEADEEQTEVEPKPIIRVAFSRRHRNRIMGFSRRKFD